MAEDAATLQSEIDALDAQIHDASLVKQETRADRSVTFRDLDEMLKYRAILVARLSALSNTSRTRLASTDKGV